MTRARAATPIVRIGLPTAAYKVVLTGTMSGVQDWSTSFWVARTGGTEPTQDNVLNNTVSFGALIGTLWTSVGSYVSAVDTLDEVKGYYYAPGALNASLIGVDLAVATTGHGTGNLLPAQLALVSSLRSANPGRSGRGRMYFPLTDTNALVAGQATDACCTTFAQNLAAMFTAINASVPAEGGTLDVIVASFTKGTADRVVTIVTDSKVDTQRRREDKIRALHTQVHVVV